MITQLETKVYATTPIATTVAATTTSTTTTTTATTTITTTTKTTTTTTTSFSPKTTKTKYYIKGMAFQSGRHLVDYENFLHKNTEA